MYCATCARSWLRVAIKVAGSVLSTTCPSVIAATGKPGTVRFRARATIPPSASIAPSTRLADPPDAFAMPAKSRPSTVTGLAQAYRRKPAAAANGHLLGCLGKVTEGEPSPRVPPWRLSRSPAPGYGRASSQSPAVPSSWKEAIAPPRIVLRLRSGLDRKGGILVVVVGPSPGPGLLDRRGAPSFLRIHSRRNHAVRSP